MRSLRLWSVATALLIVSGAPALAGETGTPPASGAAAPAVVAAADLKIAVSVPDESYVVDQEVPIEVVITNSGEADGKTVTATVAQKAGSPFSVDTSGFGKFAAVAGDTVAAGTSVPLHLKGKATDGKNGDSQLTFRVSSPDDPSTEGAVQDITVKIVPTTRKSKVGGVFYGDANNNGTFDDGEGLANVGVKLTPVSSTAAFGQVKTDANGRFDFTDVPARVYRLDPDTGLPNDWLAPLPQTIVVGGTETTTDLRVRAAKPLSGVLKASVKFKEGPYKPGDDAHLTITLINSGPVAIEHVVARCEQTASGWHLAGHKDSALWGALATPGGVTIDVGETRVLQVTGKVPQDTINSGVVYIACQFGPADGQYLAGFPSVFALAKVPGKNGTLTATFYHDVNNNGKGDSGEEVPGLEVILHDPLDGTQVAKATTAADGSLKFANIPACWYVAELSGGWRLKDNGFIPVNAKDTQDGAILVVPKSQSSPADQGQNAPLPAKLVRTPQELAATSAEVTGPAITGFALLLAGTAMVLFTRRRRHVS